MAVSAGAGDTFDYVIVGSGAAGSVLAHRLTEEPGATVCVLEAGPPDRHPFIHIPAGFIKMLFNPDFTWQFKTEPSEGSGGRRDPHHAGAHAGRVQLDQRHDLQPRAARRSRQLGAARQPRLGLCRLLPYYKRTERRIGIADDRIHGREGNLPVTDIDWIHPICEAFIDGAVGIGYPALHRLQQRRPAGWRRLFPARDPSRLAALGRARVPASGEGDRTARDPHRCARRRGAVRRQARDRRALCRRSRPAARSTWCRRGARSSSRAGTANTAKLLQISGVGPAELLGSIGVPVVHELRGVGENFRDHYAARLVARVRRTARRSTRWRAASGWRGRSCAGRWASPASSR